MVVNFVQHTCPIIASLVLYFFILMPYKCLHFCPPLYISIYISVLYFTLLYLSICPLIYLSVDEDVSGQQGADQHPGAGGTVLEDQY